MEKEIIEIYCGMVEHKRVNVRIKPERCINFAQLYLMDKVKINEQNTSIATGLLPMHRM